MEGIELAPLLPGIVGELLDQEGVLDCSVAAAWGSPDRDPTKGAEATAKRPRWAPGVEDGWIRRQVRFLPHAPGALSAPATAAARQSTATPSCFAFIDFSMSATAPAPNQTLVHANEVH